MIESARVSMNRLKIVTACALLAASPVGAGPAFATYLVRTQEVQQLTARCASSVSTRHPKWTSGVVEGKCRCAVLAMSALFFNSQLNLEQTDIQPLHQSDFIDGLRSLLARLESLDTFNVPRVKHCIADVKS